MFDIDVNSLTEQELIDLVKFCDDTKIKVVARLVTMGDDFDTKFENWRKFGIKEDRTYTRSFGDEIRNFIDEHMYPERYQTVDFEYLLEVIEERLEEEEITKEVALKLKTIMMEKNFGSLTWDW
jgi:hypothetical protein